MKIILSNWTSGGTGLTNFLKDELPLYERAIDRHGDPDYIICSKALGTEYLPLICYPIITIRFTFSRPDKKTLDLSGEPSKQSKNNHSSSHD